MFSMSDRKDRVESAACALGWTSLGIGLTELLAPDRVQQMMGLDHERKHRGILQVLGLREILHGVGLLTAGRNKAKITTGLWARVAGDVLDGALLGAAAMKTRRPAGVAAVSAMVLPVAIADMVYAVDAQRQQQQSLPRRMLSRVWP
jgi:hypothetical protein